MLVKQLPDWNETPDTWFIAHPTKTMMAIDNGKVSTEASEYTRTMISKKKNFNIVLADKNKDDSVLTVWLMNTPAISDNRYYLTITITNLAKLHNKDIFIDFIKRVLANMPWECKYILIDTEQYKMNQKSVFKDRLAVGWMLYTPQIIPQSPALPPNKIFYCENDSGTIIVSKDNFDGKDPIDIKTANDVEIELAANGYLPLLENI
ncbi:Imm52 family immunity protein [Rahnella contaminans]|uniref:Imm52 family immunity protein n=1 Tax=Rahnella contaminans TaxID=2703882 RepID=UPI0023DBDA0F|nr:Imm52 family immunity protein [Rahnella contaminans]MDF1897262.1 Imm52 family immunity protein [Rahnella contaminans]